MSKFSTANCVLPYFGKLSMGTRFDKSKVIDEIQIPAYLNVPLNGFVVSMEGNSMAASGINNGDLLVIKSQNTAANGKIVIATIDNVETVIKYFEQTKDLLFLSSKNSDIKPMIFDPSRIKIVGVVVAQMRSY